MFSRYKRVVVVALLCGSTAACPYVYGHTIRTHIQIRPLDFPTFLAGFQKISCKPSQVEVDMMMKLYEYGAADTQYY